MGCLGRYSLLVLLCVLAACGSQPVNTPTVPALNNSPSNYSGVLLATELDTLEDQDAEIRARVIENVGSLEVDDPIVIYRSDERTIFQCNTSYHTGGRVGPSSNYRICAIDTANPRGQVVAQEAYAVSVSPDEQWIAILGDIENSLFDCQHQVYIAPLSLETLQPLIDPALFDEGLRSCAVNNLNWTVNDVTYTISFSLWTGGSGDAAYPIYSITFNDPADPADLVSIPLQ
jgi:hypothetical protein